MTTKHGPEQPLWMPQSADNVNDFMNSLEFTDEEIDPADIPPLPSPDDEILVVLSLRVSMGVADRIRAMAEKRNVKYTLMLREWVELMLADAESGAPLSEADALRAIEALRKLGKVA